MALGSVKIASKVASGILRISGYSSPTLPLRRPVADFGRLPRAQQRREAYKRANDRGYEQYRRQIYEQYERRLPPNLRQQIPTIQPEPIPVPTRPPSRISDPRLARRPQSNSPVSGSQQRTIPQDLPRFKEPFAAPGLRSPLNLQPPPVKPKPPRPLFRQYLDASLRINDKLEQINRGFNHIAFPGLNQFSDALNELVIRFVKHQKRQGRLVRNLLESSRENQETPPTNPEPNLTLPINPSWADTDVITV